MKVVDLRELALKKVKITGDVIGKFGTFEIEQVYKNNTKDALEVGYTFTIVETATIVGFEINVGNRVLKGKCKEKGEAKKEYQKNIVKGNSAYMMEQETDNIFKISVGKIDINEEKTERVEILNYDLSKDFKLNIELKNELLSNAITSKTRDDKDIFKKIAVTNLKIDINLKQITEQEIQNLISNNKVLDNIDDVIYYLINCL